MKKICKKAGIDAYSLHELRHTTATLLIVDAKMDIMTVSQRLRHADRGFTLNQYGHLSDSSQEKATDKLAQILKDNPS
jgi:integrase